MLYVGLMTQNIDMLCIFSVLFPLHLETRSCLKIFIFITKKRVFRINIILIWSQEYFFSFKFNKNF